MTRLTSILLSFLIATSTMAFDKKNMVPTIEGMGTVQNTAKKLCIPESEETHSFLNAYANICAAVKKSELCKNINEKDALFCQNPEENHLDVFSLSFMKNCGWGLWGSLKDLFNFLIESIKGILGYTFYSEKREKTNQAIGEYYDTFSNYLAIEYDKIKDEDESASDFEITYKLAETFQKTIFSKIGNIIEENFYNLGCYNQTARQERLCKIIGDFTVPPAAAVGLITGVPKLVKKLQISIKRHSTIKKIPQPEASAKIFQREARSLTPEEMRNPHITSVSNRLGLLLKAKKATVLSATHIGEGLKLIVIKDSKGNIETMGNPHFSQNTAVPTREINYLDHTGRETKRLVSDDELPHLESGINSLTGIIQIERLKELEKIFSIENAVDKWSLEQRRELGNWLNNLKPQERIKLNSMLTKFNSDIRGIDSHLSLSYSLRESKDISDSQKNLNEVLSMYSLFIKEEGGRKFKKFNQWVKSDAHALLLYDHISLTGLEKNKDLLRYLQTYNEYFKKAHGTRGPPTLITYSFEKESKKSLVTDWYKVSGISDEDWFKLDMDERLEKLKQVTNVKKSGVSDNIITGTDKKPLYLGRYSEELPLTPTGGLVFDWEIANKKYEINLDRTIRQVREVSNFFKETHSFHTHVVFDMPKSYKHFDRFQTWSKQTNDYLYLKGMEEGLHGNYLTSVAYFPEDPSVLLKSTVENKLPSDFNMIDFQSHKFFSMGIRKDIYGNSPLKDHDKLGLELRDTTRNLDTLSDHMNRISNSVQDFRWENFDATLKRQDLVFLRPSKDLIESKLSSELSPEFRELITELDINSSIPLTDFENGRYYNYRTKTLHPPSSAQIDRFKKGREHYIAELKNIEAELKRMDAKKESYELEDVKMALKMTLTEWARIAKAAELFENI